jgi:preprotein translocase subunit SecG
MIQVVIGLILAISVVLVLAVLAQNSKGGGLSGQFGGSSQLLGAKRTTDVLEKLTWGLGISIFVLALAANVIVKTTDAPTFTSPNVEEANQKSVISPNAQTPAADPNATTPQTQPQAQPQTAPADSTKK